MDVAPAVGLFVGLVTGVMAGLQGRSGTLWGAIACALFFVVWNLAAIPPSIAGASYATGAGVLLLLSLGLGLGQGFVWGGLWGAVGGWLGRRMAASSQ